MTMPVVVGVDPGGRSVGLVVRQGDQLLGWVVLTITTCHPRAKAVGLAVAAVEGMLRGDAVRNAPGSFHQRPLLAVEDVTHPNPHLGVTNVTGIIDTAVLVGALVAQWPDLLLVPPGGNGTGPLAAYPEALRPARGSGKGKDRLRHCRSAWDVAGAAVLLARYEDVFQGGGVG